MSLWLQSLAAEVTGYALPPENEDDSLFRKANVGTGMTSIMGDVCDHASTQRAMQAARPDIVIHMAAQALVGESYKAPTETYATNVMGTVNLLEAVRNTPSTKVVVNVTTDKCYENREWAWGYRENDPMGGFDPYSSSKGCSELISAAYRSSFFNTDTYTQHGVALATARAGNVIGGGDRAKGRLIPDIVAAFESKQPVTIRSPAAIRPWQHVLEPLRGYLSLAEKLYESGPSFAEPWNFGPKDDDVKPVAWIVERMAEMWGNGVTWQLDKGEHPHEANYLKLDISKARSRLNWSPALNLQQALELVVSWTRAQKNGAEMRAFTIGQIQVYQTLTAQ